MKRTTAILLTEVREPPDIAQADGEANTGKHELDFGAPRAPVVVRGYLVQGYCHIVGVIIFLKREKYTFLFIKLVAVK